MLNSHQFRREIQNSRESYSHHWEASRKLLAPQSFSALLPVLIKSIEQAPLEPDIQQRLVGVLHQFDQQTKNHEVHQTLKELTGLPPSKAVRSLIVWGILAVEEQQMNAAALSPKELENILRETENPYDVLLQSHSPSLLDIGAGDLSFEQELVEHYVPLLRAQSKPLVLHAFDRLAPGSQVGGIYHKNEERDCYLKSLVQAQVHYKFWGGVDLQQFGHDKEVLPRYTMCTCHAPANPTFSFEPSRLEPDVITNQLQATRGQFNFSRLDGEKVLEVSHQGRTLTFPPWKFSIIGPLALLQTMGNRGQVGILSAIDDEVFWEILSQLIEDDAYRPLNQLFTQDNLATVFGDIYHELSSLPAGAKIDLSTLVTLRTQLPLQTATSGKRNRPINFRYVEIRRGAVWEGTPSSFTARQFSQMKEESTPWWIIFVPDC